MPYGKQRASPFSPSRPFLALFGFMNPRMLMNSWRMWLQHSDGLSDGRPQDREKNSAGRPK
jgi:hypothetical protein